MNNKGLIIISVSLLVVIIGLVLLNIGWADESAYKRALRSQDIATCQEFLDRYSDSDHASEIRSLKIKLEKEKEESEYQTMLAKNDVQACKQYAQSHPNSSHIDELMAKIEDMEYEIVMDRDELSLYAEFLRNYPSSSHISSIRKIIDQKDQEYYQQYINIPTSQVSKHRLESYATLFPDGKYLEKAKKKLAELTDDDDFRSAQITNSQYSYEHYLSMHSSGKHASAARSKVQEFKEIEYYKNNSLANGAKPYAQWYGSTNSCSSWYCSQIKVKASYNSDVLVLIKRNSSYGSVVRHAYIKAGHSYTFDLADGTYQVFFYYGKGWYPKKQMPDGVKGGFLLNEDVQKDNPVTLDSQILTYELVSQVNGNFNTKNSNLNEMF